MIEFDWRAVDGSKYVPQLRCMASHFMPEMSLVIKDDFYSKFEQLVVRMRNCDVFKYHSYKIFSVIKADNDKLWDKNNVKWKQICDKHDIRMLWPSKEDDRDASEAEVANKIVEQGVKKGLAQMNLHPVFWIWFYKYFLWCVNRHATISNSAVRSVDGDQSRPIEDITFGLYSRLRISRELCSAVMPGSVLMVKRKKGEVIGSCLNVRVYILIAVYMVGDQVVGIDPFTKREHKVKQFTLVELADGITWHQFCGLAESGYFRSGMKIPATHLQSKKMVVLKVPDAVGGPKLALKTPTMESVIEKYERMYNERIVADPHEEVIAETSLEDTLMEGEEKGEHHLKRFYEN